MIFNYFVSFLLLPSRASGSGIEAGNEYPVAEALEATGQLY